MSTPLPPFLQELFDTCARQGRDPLADDRARAWLDQHPEALEGFAALRADLHQLAHQLPTKPRPHETPWRPWLLATVTVGAAAVALALCWPATGAGAPGGPAAGEPAAGEPAAGEPAAGGPAAGWPAAGGPAAGGPAAGWPAAGDADPHRPLPRPAFGATALIRHCVVREQVSDTSDSFVALTAPGVLTRQRSASFAAHFPPTDGVRRCTTTLTDQENLLP